MHVEDIVFSPESRVGQLRREMKGFVRRKTKVSANSDAVAYLFSGKSGCPTRCFDSYLVTALNESFAHLLHLCLDAASVRSIPRRNLANFHGYA